MKHIFFSFLLILNAYSTNLKHLSYEESDPNKLKWMIGFPPPNDKLITQPQSNFFSFPKLRWTVCHIRELMPTKQVSKGLDSFIPLEYDLNKNIDNITFYPLNQSKLMTWKESLSKNYTDGILILHKNKIIYEKYSGCLTENNKHAIMSMTKSITGLLAESLVVEGLLDDTLKVSTILPELKGSAFADATVRQVMNMTTGLKYSENYANPKADIWVYSQAASPLPKPKSYSGPNGYYEYLQTVQKEGNHGESFSYKTINSDVLGWIISKITNKDMTKLLSKKIWSRIGAEQDAYMTIDSKGIPFAGGGISAGLRDLAKIGLLMLNDGKFNNQQIIPKKAIQNIEKGGNKEVFAKAGYTTLPRGSYKSMWWIFHNSYGAYAARGVHGQTIYIDPIADMVIVRLSSFPTAANKNIDPTSLPAYEAVANFLLKNKN